MGDLKDVSQGTPERTSEKKETKISAETARKEMQKFLDSYDIDINDLELENGPEWMRSVINRLVRAIQVGYVEILDNGEVKHNLAKPNGETTSIKYGRLNGTALKERGKVKENFDKDCAFMGSLGNTFPNSMAKLDAIDISIFQRLSQLFMVV